MNITEGSSRLFVLPHQILDVHPAKSPRTKSASDATIAISQDALSLLLQRAIDHPISTSSSGSWGPFTAGYSVSLQLSGGTITLIDLGQQVRLDGVVVWGTIGLSLGLDLGRVLPHVCIPPERVCIGTPWGDVCTPQVCVSWPSISVAVPLVIPPVGLSANFQVAVEPDGSDWNLVLKVFPFSLGVDLRPMVNAIINALEDVVRNTLGHIPLIGDLIEGLVDTVLNALRSVIDAGLGAINTLIEEAIILIDLFSPTIPFKVAHFASTQKLLSAGQIGDREVDLIIAQIMPPIVANPEIEVQINFA